jgi:hypothetical protein
MLTACLLIAGLLGVGAYFVPVFQVAATSAVGSGAVPDALPAPSKPFTLLLGSDDDAKFAPDRFNTQSMIPVRVNPADKQATMLSIPRDLWVPIADLQSLSIGAPDTLVSGELVASPAFSWNGLNLAYLAPAEAGGSFQVWTVAASGPAGRASPGDGKRRV